MRKSKTGERSTAPAQNLPVLVLISLLCGSNIAHAADSPAPAPEPVRTWTATLQGGFTNTFQLILGGYFGKGADFQNRATVSLNNAFRAGDSFGVFGWSTTDLTSHTPNWQAGFMYKTRVFTAGSHTLTATGGIQRWVLPLVKTGAKDWHAVENVSYSTRVRSIPVVVSSDWWTMLASTLPTGTAVYTQAYTQHKLWRRPSFDLQLRQGPAHSYSWGLYGAKGNRVLRYSGTLVASWKKLTIEAGCRQQYGLKDGIPNNRYWSVLVSRSITRPFFGDR